MKKIMLLGVGCLLLTGCFNSSEETSLVTVSCETNIFGIINMETVAKYTDAEELMFLEVNSSIDFSLFGEETDLEETYQDALSEQESIESIPGVKTEVTKEDSVIKMNMLIDLNEFSILDAEELELDIDLELIEMTKADYIAYQEEAGYTCTIK